MSIIGGTVPRAVAVPPTSYEDNTPLKLLSHTCRKSYESLSNTDRKKHARTRTYMMQHINKINTTSPRNTLSILTHTHARTYAQIQYTCMHTFKQQTYMYTYTHTDKHVHMEIYTNNHTHTHTHTYKATPNVTVSDCYSYRNTSQAKP